MKIGVIGLGAGGQLIAAHAASLGDEVIAYGTKQVADLKKRGGIIQSNGALLCEGNITQFAADEKEVCNESDILFLAVGNDAYQPVFEKIKSSVRENQLIVLPSSLLGSSIKTLELIRSKQFNLKPCIIELSCLPYSVMVDAEKGNGFLLVGAVKNTVYFSYPAECTEAVAAFIHWLKKLYPGLKKTTNLIHNALFNPNMIVHTIGSLLNISKIVSGEPWYFYKEGFSDEVIASFAGVDKERIEIAHALGFKMNSFVDIAINFYKFIENYFNEKYISKTYQNLFVCLQQGEHAHCPGPKNFESRFFKEDFCYGLYPLYLLAKYLILSTPYLDHLIKIANEIYFEAFLSCKKTIEKDFSVFVSNGGAEWIGV